MNKIKYMTKKGFSLIELLAVVIILAILALLVIPLVGNLIRQARINAAVVSAYGYVEAVNNEIISKNTTGISIEEKMYSIEDYSVDDEILNVKYEGKGPSTGWFTLGRTRVTDGDFCINGFEIKYENGVASYVKEGNNCSDANNVVVTNNVCDLLEDNSIYSSIDVYGINTIEDLYCLSKAVNNNAYSFRNKIIVQNNDLDFFSESSYLDATKNADYDINGDGTISDLKTEFTTGKGFIPIGDIRNPFEGSYDGKNKKIAGLIIKNRGDNLGLFGAIYGHNSEFKNIIINGSRIEGGSNIGTLAGILGGSTTQNNIQTISCNLNGNINVGGVVGAFENVFYSSDSYGVVDKDNNNSIANYIIKSNTYDLAAATSTGSGYGIGTSTGTGLSSATSSGSGSGSGSGSQQSYEPYYDAGYYRVAPVHTINNIKISGTRITAHSTAGSYAGGIYVGDENLNSYQVYKMIQLTNANVTLSNMKIDDSNITSQYGNCGILVGTDASKVNYRNISIGNSSVDVTVGGNAGGLAGSVLFLSGDVQHNEINKSSIQTYGSSLSRTGGLFGSILGPGKFLDNKILLSEILNRYDGGEYIGGAIGIVENWVNYDIAPEEVINNIDITPDFKATSIINSDIKGSNHGYYVGGFIGKANTPISISSEVLSINNNIDGYYYVGGIFGELKYAKNNSVKYLYSSSNIMSCGMAGGLVGVADGINVSGFVGGGTYKSKCTSATPIGIGIGLYSNITPSNIYRSDDIVLDLNYGRNTNDSYDGELVEDNYKIIEIYDSLFDTLYGGDSNNDGFYLDFDNRYYSINNPKSVRLYPSEDHNTSKITISGNGTASNPYILSSEQDFKDATLLANGGYYFRLANDIDISTFNHFYPLGSVKHPFNGHLDGNNKTITNPYSTDNVYGGIVGSMNNGTVTNLNVNN